MISYFKECYILSSGLSKNNKYYWDGIDWTLDKSKRMIIEQWDAKKLMLVLLKKYTWIYKIEIKLNSKKMGVFTLLGKEFWGEEAYKKVTKTKLC